jgi:hypothetical protein
MLALGCGLLLVSSWLAFSASLSFAAKASLASGAAAAASAAALRRWLGTARADALFTRLGLLVCALAIGLLGAELGLRLLLRDITTTGDFTSYFAMRWRRGVHLNDYGFRERNFEAAKPPDLYRIAVVGDSFAYGQGLPVEERFSDRLESSLNARSGGKLRYQVLNFGRPGAATQDHVEILLAPVLDLAPDFVLLQWYRNDIEGPDLAGRPRSMRLIPSDYLIRLLHERSALYYLASSNWDKLQGALGWSGDYDAYMHERFADPQSPGSLAARRQLERFVELCRERGIAVGMVIFPVMWGDDGLGYLRERVLAQCRELEIPCLDLAPDFAAFPDRSQLWVNPLDSHPGARANQLAARRIEERFGELWGAAPPP